MCVCVSVCTCDCAYAGVCKVCVCLFLDAQVGMCLCVYVHMCVLGGVCAYVCAFYTQNKGRKEVSLKAESDLLWRAGRGSKEQKLSP